MNYKSQTITAVVITHNNADSLEDTLSSLRWADELVVLDRGSTDGSLAIARHFTDKIFFHPAENPTILRRDALSLGTCDWLLLIEPEEWVEEMLKHEIDGVLLNTNPAINGYTIPRRLKMQGQWLDQGTTERFLRLVRNKHWTVSEDWDAHLLLTSGEVGHLDRPLGYEPYHTVQELFSAANDRSTLAAYRHLAEHGVSAWEQNLLHIGWKTKWAAFRSYFLQGGIQTGFTGWMLAMAQMLETFLKYAKIRTLTRKA